MQDSPGVQDEKHRCGYGRLYGTFKMLRFGYSQQPADILGAALPFISFFFMLPVLTKNHR